MSDFKDHGPVQVDRTAKYVFWAIVLLLAWQIFSAYPNLPNRIASHFGVSGKPNAWMSKQAFLRLDIFLVGILAILFYFSGFFMNKIPTAFINLPDKDFWLAPQRREQSQRVIANFLLWLGNGTLIFIFVLQQHVIHYNLNPRKYPSGIGAWAPIIFYLLFVFLWTAALFWRFRSRKNRDGVHKKNS